MGLDFTAPPVGLLARSKRYALYAEDGVVKQLHLEERPRHLRDFRRRRRCWPRSDARPAFLPCPRWPAGRLRATGAGIGGKIILPAPVTRRGGLCAGGFQ